MAFDFPSSPTNGQIYTSGGASYVYNGYGWDVQATLNPANYVLKAGDTMTGDLTIDKTNPSLWMKKAAAGQEPAIIGTNGANFRWAVVLGDTVGETGSNAGSNFNIRSFTDAGASLAAPLSINRATGAATFSGPVNSGFAGTLTTPDPKQFIAGYGFSAASAIAINGYLTTVPSWKFLASGYMSRIWVNGAALQIDLSSASGTANADMTTTGAAFVLDPTGSSFNTSLWLTTSNPNLTLNKTASGQTNSIFSRINGTARWVIQPGDGATESGGNAGSDFTIHYYADNGTYLNKALTITRANGNMAVGAAVYATGFFANYNANAGTYYFGTSGSKYLTNDGNAYSLAGGNLSIQGSLSVNGALGVSSAGATNAFNANLDTFTLINSNSATTGGAHVQYNRCTNDACWTYAALNAAGNAWGWYLTGAGNSVQAGNLTIYGRGYQQGGGSWGDSSDIRIKNVLGKYEHGLDEILQLEPIRYTFKGNDTVDPPAHVGKGLEVPEDLIDVPIEAPYLNSPHYESASKAKEFIGLVAQAVEGVMPEMVTMREGMIDGKPVTDLRDIENSALIYALVNAVKTLAARIETLERRT
jgi:hypothetical protein